MLPPRGEPLTWVLPKYLGKLCPGLDNSDHCMYTLVRFGPLCHSRPKKGPSVSGASHSIRLAPEINCGGFEERGFYLGWQIGNSGI